MLAGGRDIEAWRYGREAAHPSQGQSAPLLDEIELSYARLAVEAGVPLLAICRGCQVLDVAFGGSLYGDLDEFPEGGADHPGAKWDEWRALVAATLEGREPPPHPTHPVEIASGSLLAGHLGDRAVVDSYHHQAIRDLGEGIVAVARAPHGVIEAVEMPAARAFVLGVQWELHEEWQTDDATFGIWRAFVEAARRRSEDRDVAGSADDGIDRGDDRRRRRRAQSRRSGRRRSGIGGSTSVGRTSSSGLLPATIGLGS